MAALGIEIVYFTSLDPSVGGWWGIAKAVLPTALAFGLLLGFLALRGFPSRELRYVAGRERFLYGSVERRAER